MAHDDEVERPPEEELDEPMATRSLPPLEDLPDREWLAAVIADVTYEYAMFNGKIQYLEDQKTKEPILDEDNNPIPRKIFKITYELVEFFLSNGSPRKGWLNLGLAFGKNAKLPKYLKKLNFDIDMDNLPSPRKVIDHLKGMHVFIQFEQVEAEDGTSKQKLVGDAIKQALEPHQVKSPDEEPKKEPSGNQISKEEERAWDE